MTKIYEFYQRGLTIIFFLRIFGTRRIKTWKNWPIFSSFNPSPSMPSKATGDRKQFQYLQIVVSTKTISLVLEFNWCQDTFYLFIKLPNSVTPSLNEVDYYMYDDCCNQSPPWEMICGHGQEQKFKYPYPRDSRIIQMPYLRGQSDRSKSRPMPRLSPLLLAPKIHQETVIITLLLFVSIQQNWSEFKSQI